RRELIVTRVELADADRGVDDVAGPVERRGQRLPLLELPGGTEKADVDLTAAERPAWRQERTGVLVVLYLDQVPELERGARPDDHTGDVRIPLRVEDERRD